MEREPPGIKKEDLRKGGEMDIELCVYMCVYVCVGGGRLGCGRVG